MFECYKLIQCRGEMSRLNFKIMAKKTESPSELIELFTIVREVKKRNEFNQPPEYPQICNVYHLICNDLRNKRFDRVEELRLMWQNISSL